MGDLRLTRGPGPCRWTLAPEGGMKVPGVVFAGDGLIDEIRGTKALEQVRNVAFLPGILAASYAMPDIHEGYGFPIGGVAATSAEDGVVSPGGIGYDINCGVRLLLSALSREDVGDGLPLLVDTLFRKIPSGLGKEGSIRLSRTEMDEVLAEGARWALRRGYGETGDLDRSEENGCMKGADPGAVSDKAYQRGRGEIGTLGSGNHFIEVGYVSDVYDASTASTFGMFPGQVVFWVHSGSRGLGHQVCTEYLVVMRRAVEKYGISLPDRQLDCAPLSSPEGKRYFSAMAAAANYAWANRQVLSHLVRQAALEVFPEIPRLSKQAGNWGDSPSGLRLLYDVAHNIGKVEEHVVEGRRMKVLLHRKGATRAFGPGFPEVPAEYRAVGQPVLIPGDMGRASYVMAGTTEGMGLAFGSACHGAGRAMSRAAARKSLSAEALKKDLSSRGILVRSATTAGLVEEAPSAYKDVEDVVEATAKAGLAAKVARLRPMGVIKG